MPGRSVSTHSRLKAAGNAATVTNAAACCFNTQPPEGGWNPDGMPDRKPDGFNTQPPEGGWAFTDTDNRECDSFNTQPPEGGWTNKL